MPELPEIESIRRTLAPHLIGRRVVSAEEGPHEHVRAFGDHRDLLAGCRLEALLRHGKQLALAGRRPPGREAPVVALHLGMSGSLRFRPPGERPPPDPHVHLLWRFEGGATLALRDPRRFGGAWCFPGIDALRAHRWSRLGPDALTITPSALGDRLARSRRPLKSALLDQQRLAGLGNIYVDELLFRAGLNPQMPACGVSSTEARRLVRRMRALLEQAIRGGGSTLRDHVSATGEPGRYQDRHRVYGRGGEPCPRCRHPFRAARVAGRNTTWCEVCQKTGSPSEA